MVIGHTPQRFREDMNLDLINPLGNTVKVYCVDGGIAYGGGMQKFDGGSCVEYEQRDAKSGNISVGNLIANTDKFGSVARQKCDLILNKAAPYISSAKTKFGELKAKAANCIGIKPSNGDTVYDADFVDEKPIANGSVARNIEFNMRNIGRAAKQGWNLVVEKATPYISRAKNKFDETFKFNSYDTNGVYDADFVDENGNVGHQTEQQKGRAYKLQADFGRRNVWISLGYGRTAAQ